MTVEEAKALILREGISDNGAAPEDAVFIMLHNGYPLDHAQVRLLTEAVDIVHTSIEGASTLNRRLASALWTLGVEASSTMCIGLDPVEINDVTDLFYAIESAVHDY